MNTELMLRVAEAIEAAPEKFDMGSFMSDYENRDNPTAALDNCGTTACIAGWAVALSPESEWIFYTDSSSMNGSVDIEDTAQKVLELNNKQVSRLFYVDSYTIWDELEGEYDFNYHQYSSVTAYAAADVLRRIVKGDIEL